jgi:uncharacterized protein (DUF2267 family)
MSTHGLEGLERTVQLTHIWINELDRRLEWNDKPRSYRLLKAVLHTLRDSLQINEAADLGAQLPTLLRGAYYEQWKPATTPVKFHGVAGFLERVNHEFKRDPLPDPAMATIAVFQLLTKKVTEGEIEDVRRCLPLEIRNIWPEPYRAPGALRH